MIKKAQVINCLNEKNFDEFIESVKSTSILGVPKDEDDLIDFVSCLLPGTVIGQSLSQQEDRDILCIPAMSMHLSMPLKTGEYFWYFEDEEAKGSIKENSDLTVSRPLSAINAYWLSRVHGTLLSEDVNFSFRERDGKFTTAKPDDLGVIKIPDFKNFGLFDKKEDLQKSISDEELYNNSLSEGQFNSKAVPRYFAHPDELSLQGSYNTLINLTKEEDSDFNEGLPGAIDIVAGRLSLQDFVEEDDLLEFDKKIDVSDDTTLKFKINQEKYNIIENSLEQPEMFKLPDVYLYSDEKFNANEKIKRIPSQDASRILVSEALNLEIEDQLSSDSFYYKKDFIEDIKLTDYDKNTIVDKTIEKKYHDNNSFKINLKNLDRSFVTSSSLSLPSIFMKTNNIRIIARKSLTHINDEDKILPDGDIRIVKESDSFIDNAHILLESNGNVNIDGNIITIGSFEKEYAKSIGKDDTVNIDEIYKELENQKTEIALNEKIINMHGNGSGVLLGYNENLSEPLVLGNTLHSFMTEILNIQIKSFNLIADAILEIEDHLRDIETAISTHFHPHPLGPTSPDPALSSRAGKPLPLERTKKEDVLTNLQNEGTKIKDLKGIVKNLDHILSRFSKTS
tara:strand:- start:482 stop:2350 length:1869 start_codon:yes stop_codon:yes gene_type:complete